VAEAVVAKNQLYGAELGRHNDTHVAGHPVELMGGERGRK